MTLPLSRSYLAPAPLTSGAEGACTNLGREGQPYSLHRLKLKIKTYSKQNFIQLHLTRELSAKLTEGEKH